MKKIIIATLLITTVLIGCKKDEEYGSPQMQVNFYNISKTQSILKDWVDADDTITFDVFIPNTYGSDIQVNFGIIADETTMTEAMYTLSGTSLTIAQGQLKATGNIIFHYDAITDVAETISLELISAGGILLGPNDTLMLSSVKMANPTLTVFNDASLIALYDGWNSPVEMAPINAVDPANDQMTLYNLWWGGETIIVDFNLDNNTVYIEADQALDVAWAQSGYTLPWIIGEVNGTYDPIAKTITFDYEILDINHQSYGTEPCTIQDDV